MKALLVLSMFSCACFTFDVRAAAALSGSPVQFVVKNEVPQFTFRYAYDLASVSVALVGTVVTSTLPKVRPIYFRFTDVNSGAGLTEWRDLNLGTSPQQELLTVDLKNRDALQVLKALPNVVVLFSVDKIRVDGSLSLAVLCSTNRLNFVDMTQTRSGCSPDKSVLDQLPDQVGGSCSAHLHEEFCSSTYDDVRDTVARQYHCTFSCHSFGIKACGSSLRHFEAGSAPHPYCHSAAIAEESARDD